MRLGKALAALAEHDVQALQAAWRLPVTVRVKHKRLFN
jgi:hypothetical protein